MASTVRTSGVVGWLSCWLVTGGAALAAEAPAIDRALRLPPAQSDAQFDMPEGADVAKCTIEVEKNGKSSGWVVRDGQGTVLRRFIDSDGDNQVDQWCYYRYGIEVYRDVDTNSNKIADQYRWLNTAGARIGIDKNEDKKIDSWQNLSAEEATAELVAAIRDRDPARFARLLLTEKEADGLGLGKEKASLLVKKLKLAPANFATLMNQQKLITPQTKWVSFAASQPGIVPAGTDESTSDVLVYENVAAMIETDGKPQAINVGTLVRTAGGWRLIDAPQIEGEGLAEVEPRNFFFTMPRPDRNNEPQVAGKPSDKATKLMDELNNLGDQEFEKRAGVIEQLAEEADGEMRNNWYRQLADMLSASVQTGAYPAGIDKLKALEEKLKANPADEELAFYAKFRWLTAEHGQALAGPNPPFQSIQAKWIEDLEKFVQEAKKYPDSADAMLELAISYEFAGEDDKALNWYETIVKEYPSSPIHAKAQGAKTRLSCINHTIPLTGKLVNGGSFDLTKLRGKVVVVQYWATWCEPCKADMPLLKELRTKFKDKFEVVGINLDNDSQAMAQFLKENSPPWPQLYAEGGLENRYAVEMGIQTLPTMLLIDKEGRVVDRNIRAQGLESEVIKLLK